jgi:hypothetical protein
MRALLPLTSAISFLILAGALALRWAPWGALGALVCVVAAALLLVDHDREVAMRAADEVLDDLNALPAKPHEAGGEQ